MLTPSPWPRIGLGASWFFVLALGVHEAVWTYAHTPDVQNFRAFAEPGSSRAEGKISYLFSPLAIMFFFVAVGIAHLRRGPANAGGEAKYFWGAVIATLFILFAGGGLWLSCHRALVAAGLG